MSLQDVSRVEADLRACSKQALDTAEPSNRAGRSAPRSIRDQRGEAAVADERSNANAGEKASPLASERHGRLGKRGNLAPELRDVVQLDVAIEQHQPAAVIQAAHLNAGGIGRSLRAKERDAEDDALGTNAPQ